MEADLSKEPGSCSALCPVLLSATNRAGLSREEGSQPPTVGVVPGGKSARGAAGLEDWRPLRVTRRSTPLVPRQVTSYLWRAGLGLLTRVARRPESEAGVRSISPRSFGVEHVAGMGAGPLSWPFPLCRRACKSRPSVSAPPLCVPPQSENAFSPVWCVWTLQPRSQPGETQG